MGGTRKSARNHASSSTATGTNVSVASRGTKEAIDTVQPEYKPSTGEGPFQDSAATLVRKRKAAGGTGERPRKRTKGKLSDVLTLMPNEVVSEICSYLQPSDLLHLVLSSKVFAVFLLATASAPIWRYARLSLKDLPGCPSGITEQQYACLVFGHYCQVSTLSQNPLYPF
ncbi:hypothetical protein DL93DRAFT_1184083 [Clavulina sp. PMI_390]|nr:hypothetical protein DL93DRAFT_1184083 [Clavulina sp. PMI_390]